MDDKIDINKIAADFLQHNIEHFVDAGIGILKGAADIVRLRLNRTYSAYLKNILERYSTAKSFFIRTEPVYLYTYYVPLSVATQQITLDKPRLLDIVKLSPFSIITGSAGSGKSMFMRHLLLNTIFAKEKVPVYIELRELNRNSINLRAAVAEVLKHNGLNVVDDYLEKALEAGHFVLLLDGFDELALDKHKEARQELSAFAEKYSNCWVVMSSRPDSYLEGLQGFSMLNVQPLGLDQACELIEKLPFDEEISKKFLKELRQDLFKKHQSFLSNPLLLSIMLLTYGQSADIPTKLNVFYNQAYEALFQRHDALKGGFQREKSTKLDIQDFAKVFSAFCLQTYDKREFQFSRMKALQYIDKVKEITRLDYKSADFLNDALQAVCLMVEDSLLITFAHRSFQEYFAALFIYQAKPEIQKRLIERYSSNVGRDNIFGLLYEMRPDMIERHYILPKINQLRKLLKIKKTIGITHYTRYLKGTFQRFSIEEDLISWGHVSKNNIGFFDFIHFTLHTCGHLVGWRGYEYEKMRKFLKMYAGKVIEAKNLSYKSPFVRDLAEGCGTISLHSLRLVLEVGELLERKQQEAEASLEDILGSQGG